MLLLIRILKTFWSILRPWWMRQRLCFSSKCRCCVCVRGIEADATMGHGGMAHEASSLFFPFKSFKHFFPSVWNLIASQRISLFKVHGGCRQSWSRSAGGVDRIRFRNFSTFHAFPFAGFVLSWFNGQWLAMAFSSFQFVLGSKLAPQGLWKWQLDWLVGQRKRRGQSEYALQSVCISCFFPAMLRNCLLFSGRITLLGHCVSKRLSKPSWRSSLQRMWFLLMNGHAYRPNGYWRTGRVVTFTGFNFSMSEASSFKLTGHILFWQDYPGDVGIGKFQSKPVMQQECSGPLVICWNFLHFHGFCHCNIVYVCTCACFTTLVNVLRLQLSPLFWVFWLPSCRIPKICRTGRTGHDLVLQPVPILLLPLLVVCCMVVYK